MRIRDEYKEQIVREKALDLIVNDGLDNFSMQKLAKAAGVSPATLYIYYKDKEDLILQLGIAEGKRMTDATMKDFDPQMPFVEGLKIQWRNRANFALMNVKSSLYFEQLKNSSFRDKVSDSIKSGFKEKMGVFIKNAIKNKELAPMPLEVFWSMAYAPLYNLIRFHNEGRSLGNRPFVFSDEIMWHTFELVIKALKP